VIVSKSIPIKDRVLSYYDTNNSPAKYTLLFFSPGPTSGTYFHPFFKLFPKSFRLVSFDYYGRGKSSRCDKFSYEMFARDVEYLIRELKLQDITLVGVSFGTCVVNSIVEGRRVSISKVVLVTPGEFFNNFVTLLLRIAFIPPKFSKRVQLFYRYILTSKLRFFGPDFPKTNLDLILSQWLYAIKYKIPLTLYSTKPCMIVTYKNDSIVTKESRVRLRHCYPNSFEIWFNGPHTISYQGGNLVRWRKHLLPAITSFVEEEIT